MGLDGAMFQQAGSILPSCNAEASQRGFFNNASDSSNSMVMLGEFQKMMEGEGLARRTYIATQIPYNGAFNNAEMQVTFGT